ncbi:MAG: hypothetical protein J6C33_02285 [Lachnospiraceae bacterium]|nr:hypothetical protein [Lachnospiraceae bacterium]
MKDRRLNNILMIAICLVLAVIGAIYEIYSMQDGVTLEEFLNMENGAEDEESY